MKAWLKRNFYRFYYFRRKVKIRRGVTLDTRNFFEGDNMLDEHVEVAGCRIGRGTYVSEHTILRKTRVGRFCSIGGRVWTGLGTHPSRTVVSTHPAFFSTEKQAGFSFVDKQISPDHLYTDPEKKYVVEIGNDVWVGNNVLIADGVTIGDGAIIAGGAVVTANVAPYSIVAGVPAVFKRLRFTPDQVSALLTIKWWQWDMATLKAKSALFADIDRFIEANK
ncbi:CatB-related O-acetyltransferase [Hufsiella ginkgonis]|uniref:Antibiotic acetyltransferase n=1 Tax=Hufsiella ginkgonis TaxID=2695274 RepID=A0A7K1Y2C0_9SPHI|nr:CatB-related O-acetyltransferase [Hufsiella ginkgonis]MXV17405.1 antibiotic acetyltransferase [Hufsiella ginkgonis]